MSELPSFQQVLDLPAVFDRVVEPEFIDQNGHMNIGDYLQLGSWAIWESTKAAGIDHAYVDEQQMSLFTVEQHLRYHSELRLGDRFTVHTRLLERSSRAVHAMAFVLDRENDALANTQETTLVHVSTTLRRSVDLPAPVATAVDAVIAEHAALEWSAPVCGAMGLRRR